MYSVKVLQTSKLVSWHQETPAGLAAAVEEANMRTHGFGFAHTVTDNNGYRLHLALPADVAKKLEQVRKERRYDRLIAWLGFALLMLAIFCRR